jgi:hypothetical protein
MSKGKWGTFDREKYLAGKRRWYLKYKDRISVESKMKYSSNPEPAKTRARVQREQPGFVRLGTLKRYGLTQETYAAMVVEQDNVCAICRRPEESSRHSGRRLVIDHDHKTGRVRKLLCSKCNAGIGLLREDPLVLEAAIKYLRQFIGG